MLFAKQFIVHYGINQMNFSEFKCHSREKTLENFRANIVIFLQGKEKVYPNYRIPNV